MATPGFTLAPRDPFADAKQTLSSWDNCMAKDYCKWPVIVAIIIGGLIAFSVVFCIARCICCGAECALCCCKCCTCCCGSSSSGHKRMKSDNQGYPPQPYPYPQHQQQPYANNPYAEARSFAPPPPPPQITSQYQSHPAPSLTRQPTNPNFNPQVNPKFAPAPAPAPEQPQYATFDAHARPVNEDALPAMPSWSDARSRHVEVEDQGPGPQEGGVEMDRLTQNGSVPAAAYGVNMRAEPGAGRSPVSPVHGGDAYAYQDYERRVSPAQSLGQYQNQNVSPYAAGAAAAAAVGGGGAYPRGPSPAQSYSQYSQTSDPYAQNIPYNAPTDRYTSPPPPSYHTTAQNPYTTSYTPSPSTPAQGQAQSYYNDRSHSPAYPTGSATPIATGTGIPTGTGYEPVPRSAAATPSYPGQATYQAFSPGQSAQAGGMGVVRKPLQGSLRDV